jgi:hypothetical protein
MNPRRNPWITITVFAIAMGLLEAIVVVYLREIYYPEGFAFPLKAMKPGLLSTEILRELATLIMLITVGLLTGRNGTTRFAWFIFAFAVWDIFYYVFLKALLNWPESLLTWDILFLIPVTWVGPVLAPLINSITMIGLSLILIRGSNRISLKVKNYEWMLLIIGSIIVILSYTKEYTSFMLIRFNFPDLFHSAKTKELLDFATTFIPGRFDWAIFSSGVLLHLFALGSIYQRSNSVKDKGSETVKQDEKI